MVGLSLLNPDQYFRTGTSKRVAYSNPEFDKLIEEEQATADNKKRVALFQQAGRILMKDVPLVPLYNLADFYAAARNVVWSARPDEKICSWDMKIRREARSGSCRRRHR